MKRPPRRIDIPPRNSDNTKRKLYENVQPELIEELIRTVTYKGSSKHKRHPHIFQLPPFGGERGDATLCDEHARFRPEDMDTVKSLIDRGLRAGLIGTNIWAIGNDGWIFQGSITIPGRAEYHGYPARPREAIAEPVYRRFRAWADAHGTPADKQAAANCATLYRFRP